VCEYVFCGEAPEWFWSFFRLLLFLFFRGH
jgi:hypothetical protein